MIQFYYWSQLNLGIWLSKCVASCRKLSDNQSMLYTNSFSCVYILVVLLLKLTADLCILLISPFCFFGIRFSSSIYFCIRLLIIDVISLYYYYYYYYYYSTTRNTQQDTEISYLMSVKEKHLAKILFFLRKFKTTWWSSHMLAVTCGVKRMNTSYSQCRVTRTLQAIQIQFPHLNINCLYFPFTVGQVAQSVQRLTTDWTDRDRIPVGTRFSARPDLPWGPPNLL